MPQLQQVIVMLPEPLVAFLKRAADREDRTLSGALRHLVSEAARVEPSPAGAPWVPSGPTIPGVVATSEGIAQAKEHIAALLEEQKQIHRRKRIHGTTVAEDARADQITMIVGVMGQRIAEAEKILPRNGGQNAV
jgi:hypothetical protein